MLCTCSPHGSPLSQEAHSWCAAPNFFHVHTPASTLPTPPEHLERSEGLRPNPGGAWIPGYFRILEKV
eukprot:6484825-Prymnesium_polylepis.1